MGVMIGMDEAGYGPNLGPLLVTATAWDVPGDPREFDFWTAMNGIASTSHTKEPLRLQIADSKQVYSPGRGLMALEKAVLSAMRLLDRAPVNLRQLSQSLAPTECRGNVVDTDRSSPRHTRFDTGTQRRRFGAARQQELFADKTADDEHVSENRTPPKNAVAEATPPWLADRNLPLPVEVDSALLSDVATVWSDVCRRTRVRLLDVRSEIVQPERFNALVRAADNKARALSRLSLNLLRTACSCEGEQPTLVICDKHGGRNQYADLLAETFGGAAFDVIEESKASSVYRRGACEIRFQMKAEQHFPVALASMVCKYVRELSMDAFNRFWQEHVPGLEPTAGYPVDAIRYKNEIAEAQLRLGISDDVLWRER